jgi:hypothetical protein
MIPTEEEAVPIAEEGAPASTPPPAPAPDDRLARLEQLVAQLAGTVQEGVGVIGSLQRSQAPKPTTQEFLDKLATDPEGTIRAAARDEFKGVADEALTPAVMQVLETGSKYLLQQHQLEVDSQFGHGTWDELFKPQLDKDLAQLRGVNPTSVADPATIQALVDRLHGGENFQRLVDRRAELAKNSNRGLSNLVPGGGAPRLRAPREDELPTDVEQFIRDTEKATGEEVDRKRFSKLYYTGVDSGPGRHRTSLLEYLKAVGASPDTLKMYGGSS